MTCILYILYIIYCVLTDIVLLLQVKTIMHCKLPNITKQTNTSIKWQLRVETQHFDSAINMIATPLRQTWCIAGLHLLQAFLRNPSPFLMDEVHWYSYVCILQPPSSSMLFKSGDCEDHSRICQDFCWNQAVQNAWDQCPAERSSDTKLQLPRRWHVFS